VDGEPAILVLDRETGTPTGVIRIDLAAGRITHISDYSHCPWILQAAASVIVDPPHSN
jgi:hypothetical protein